MTNGSLASFRAHLLPTSPLGKWSVGLLEVSVAAFVVFSLVVASGQRGGETFFDNCLLTGPILVAATSALGAAGAGIVAVLTWCGQPTGGLGAARAATVVGRV